MRKTAKLLACIGLLGALSGCPPPPIDVSVERSDDRAFLSFSQDWGLVFSRRQIPCIKRIRLTKSDTYDLADAVWSIEAVGDVQCLDIAAVEIGTVPKGWEELMPLNAVPGQTYLVRADGIGWGDVQIVW